MSSDVMSARAEINADGVWCQVLTRPHVSAGAPALFLDRDGVLVEEVHYLHKVEDTVLVSGAADVVREANKQGVSTVVVTNQSGIGRGMYDWTAFAEVQEAMLDALADEGAFINAVFACPYHKDGKPPYDVADHPARKPNPGMLLEAKSRMPIDLSRSWIVGDRSGDVAAGRRAGLRGAHHVKTGHGTAPGERKTALEYASEDYSVHGVDSIADIRPLIRQLFD